MCSSQARGICGYLRCLVSTAVALLVSKFVSNSSYGRFELKLLLQEPSDAERSHVMPIDLKVPVQEPTNTDC